MTAITKQKRPRASSKGFLVTISQLPITKTPEELNKALDSVRAKEQELGHKITALAGSLEEHVDKGIHLHFAIAFDKRRTIDLKYWNFLFDKQANIQPITWNQKDSKYRAFSYVIKTGNVAFQDAGTDEILSHIGRTYTGAKLDDYITKIIEEGATFVDLQTHRLPEVRTWAIKHKAMLITAVHDQKTIRYEREQKQKEGFLVHIKSHLSEQKKEILTWFSKIAEYGHKWPAKQCCLMLVGGTNMGKTSLLEAIAKCVRTYRIPCEKWFTRYENNLYQLIFWEEASFKDYPLPLIKMLLEGSFAQLPMKGSLTHKHDRPLICMCSNDTIKQLFMEAFLNAFQRRHCNIDTESLCDCEDMTTCVVRDLHSHFLAIKSRVKEFHLYGPIFDLLECIEPQQSDKCD